MGSHTTQLKDVRKGILLFVYEMENTHGRTESMGLKEKSNQHLNQNG
jgi:hypothetical protein